MKNKIVLLSYKLVLLIVCLPMISGCSTKIKITELDQENVTSGTEINGVPFRIKERYKVNLYKLGKNRKYKKIDIKDQSVTLPNLDRVYLLKLEGSVFADGEVSFKMREDNTFSMVTVGSTSKAPEFVSAVEEGVTSFVEADETQKVAQEDARLEAFDAEESAILAAIELENLSPNTSTLEVVKAEKKLERARILANQKARRVGLGLPFPSAGT